MLDESGISVAPPPRTRLASTLPAPPDPSIKLSNRRQRRPDLPATGSTHTNQPGVGDNSAESDNESETDSDKSSSTSETNDDDDDDDLEHSVDVKASGTNNNNGKLFYHLPCLNLRRQISCRTRCDWY